MTRRTAAGVLALMLGAAVAAVATAATAATVATAATGPTVKGRTYESWSAYFDSEVFQSNGLRCGTDALRAGRGLPARDAAKAGRGTTGLAGPDDCGVDFTHPSEDYAPQNVYTIQVVVHRLEAPITGDGVFPDSLVRTQIDVLNEDFRALAGTPGAPGTDTRIRFVLATEDPDGNPHPGFTRTTNLFWFNDLPDPLNGTYYDALAWDPNRYLNIYTLSPEAPGGLVLGYVPFLPQDGGVGTNEDGVRILWNAFGRPSANAPYDQGRTATHEVGHWIGLYHVFDGGCSSGAAPDCYANGDVICDTPPDSTSHGGCPLEAMSCGDPDPIQNYMEYTNDACMTNFTPEQTRRIRCTAQFYRPQVFVETPVVAVGDPAVARVALAPNRPNPFAASTELAFELQRAGRAKLQVLDVAGRVVRTVAEGTFGAGRHRFAWDGSDDARGRVAPGVYFYRLVTERGAETRRMIRLD